MNILRQEENNFWHSLNEPILEQLPVIEANEFLPHIGKWTNIGGGVLLSIFVAGISLTSILTYKVTVKVPATIRPVGELRFVESVITGAVQKIEVKENQVVAQGEAIAYVDDSRLRTQKSQLENNSRQTQLQLNQIDAQIGEINTQIAAQTSLINRTIIAAQAELRGTQRNYEDEQIKATADMAQAQAALTLAKVQRDRLQREKLLTATLQETEAGLTLAKVQRDRLQREKLLTTTLQEAEAGLTLAKVQRDRLQRDKVLTAAVQEAQAALTLAKVQRDRLQPIVASGAISRNFFEEKEQAVKSADAKLEEAKASAKNLVEEKEQAIKSAEAKLEEAKANAKNLVEEKEQAIKSAEAKLEEAKANAKNLVEEKDQALQVAQTNLDKAKTAIAPSNASVTVAAEKIRQEQAQGEATLAALKKERETLLQQRLEFQKQLDRTSKELQQIQNDLNQSVIRAPIAGTLLQLKLRNPGQVVQPSEAIAQIAPLDVPMQIKAQVPAQDIDKVKVDQQVQMQVSACPYPDYGTLKGTVKTIAPDALPVEKNNATPSTSEVKAYEVTIEPQTMYVGKSNRQCQLKSGMEGRADIISRQETVLHFLLRKARLIADI
ncbi:HlyD family efflux transporter periplasmic adaptor subunit [Nostocaceae cyanobacterium CENA369]|uniref:HlyD family efflux transporter periplasmic adaptor subunit n=1 Tax=Dendronalium phyllosphericum CENA369 TaxID=1725256 RepID=A0A8J7LKU7_9NOST|nr:HlyD family efflux transporter periplasmic adaptor subunit [Dendronalium phyllosphericum]MBH8576264.1 HlyD family efflux transporter periplasmic adaptor subunit [Dendronalium phyllosphericum CENA369]